ncbi:hypothetical protein SAMN05216188_11877 [Lentzea xinjiangensis]|uniref:Uncharacterized protein n=1 Tax=Lentzea xinjiangensis TaxID=402600 RepID=A0A1H9TGB4_9PSEU|nr:hypothetical protein SAMN05216188_11877 [Lentzea xinjiangensis]
MASGPTSSQPFAFYDPDTSSWRTSLPSLFEDLTESPPTWPRSGMTSAGFAYALPTSAHPTAATVGSDTPHLPTPTARDGKGPNQRGDTTCLRGALLPTPKASDTGTPGRRASPGFRPPLSQVVNEQLLPTPTAADADRSSATYVRGNPTLVGALLPTPTAADYGTNQSPSLGAAVRPSLSSLARTWTGDSSSPPSDAGKPS